MSFQEFSSEINNQFNQMANDGILLYSEISKEDVWHTYINAFPIGTDPIYLTNTTHDCNCCKSFLRQIGNIVIVKDNKIITLWDNYTSFEYPYNIVAKALFDLIKPSKISRTFQPSEKKYGAQITYTVDSPEKPRSFNHFHCNVPEAYQQHHHEKLKRYNNNFIPSLKSLMEITPDTVNTVINLITTNNLVRGEEHAQAINAFKLMQNMASNANDLNLFVWENITSFGMSIRNTVIGSLLKDLSKGKSLEQAVTSYEKKVAGDNYKRPKALITSGMIKKATKEINKRGLEPSLYRRHAKHSDMNVNDILFVDRTIQKDLQGGLLAELKPQKIKATKIKTASKDIKIDTFLSDILPNITSLKAKFENRHTSNLVNIFAAVNQDSPKLFKWNNQFSWGYNGDAADSLIKQNVSKAGGNVTGDFRVSLGWYDADDLDLSLELPSGDVLYYGTFGLVLNNFNLDVDMNAQSYGISFDSNNPVENITRSALDGSRKGYYKVFVRNFKKRVNIGKGFIVELEILGKSYEFSYPKQLSNQQNINVVDLYYDGKEMTIKSFHPSMRRSGQNKKIWNIITNDFYPVNLVTMSPNHWGENTGNRHYMFMLEGCLNPDKSRAIYNEFLMEELTPIRKTFEVLGSKALVDYSDDQLAGLGFSSTKRNNMVVLADNRPYNILF